MTTSSLKQNEAHTELGSATDSAYAHNSSTPKPIALMVLDLLGFVLIFVGIKQQFGGVDLLHPSLSFSYSGLALIIVGLIMTLPFIAWTLTTCAKVVSKIAY